jgi:hypothetical protein
MVESHLVDQEMIFLYEIQTFLSVNAYCWILTWASWIQLTLSYPRSLRFILMLPSHLSLGLPNGMKGMVEGFVIQSWFNCTNCILLYCIYFICWFSYLIWLHFTLSILLSCLLFGILLYIMLTCSISYIYCGSMERILINR